MIKIMKWGDAKPEEIFARRGDARDVSSSVAEIIKNVRERGDAAVSEYTERFDGVKLEDITVTKEDSNKD